MFTGVENRLMNSIVSLGVPGLVDLLVTAHKVHGYVASIPGAVTSFFPIVTSM